MKPTNWILFVAVVAGFVGCRDASLPEILHHDAGIVFLDYHSPSAWQVEHNFTLKNTTDTQIHLGDIQVSCGCAKCVLEHKTLMPGQTTTVTLAVNLRYVRTTSVEKAVVNWSTTNSSGSIVFQLQCDSFPRICSNLSTTDLSVDLEIVQPDKIQFELYAYRDVHDNETELSISIKGDDSNSDWIEFDGSQIDEMLDSQIIRTTKKVTLHPKKIVNRESPSSYVLRANRGNHEFTIPIHFLTKPFVTCKPSTFFLSGKNRSVLLELVTAKDSTVRSIEFDQNLLSLEPQETSNARHFVYMVTLLDDSPQNTTETTIRFIFDEIDSFECKGYVIQNP